MTIIAALSVALPFAACYEPPTRTYENHEPIACFQMWRVTFVSSCPELFLLAMDPACSIDRESESHDLRVRWDYEDDGVWDTDFLPLTLIRYEPPAPIDSWRARCQVRDAGGAYSETARFVDLTAVVPVAPDLIAGKVNVWPADGKAPVQAVEAGEPFVVEYFRKCWVEESVGVTDALLVDGKLRDARSEVCTFGSDCRVFPAFESVIHEPGTYHVTVVLDAARNVSESSEYNNVTTTVLEVVPRREPPSDRLVEACERLGHRPRGRAAPRRPGRAIFRRLREQPRSRGRRPAR